MFFTRINGDTLIMDGISSVLLFLSHFFSFFLSLFLCRYCIYFPMFSASLSFIIYFFLFIIPSFFLFSVPISPYRIGLVLYLLSYLAVEIVCRDTDGLYNYVTGREMEDSP
jgi:hypothetical protein